jgi:hypothetical protein
VVVGVLSKYVHFLPRRPHSKVRGNLGKILVIQVNTSIRLLVFYLRLSIYTFYKQSLIVRIMNK